MQQALLFARFSQHENLYAHPLVRHLRRELSQYLRTHFVLKPAGFHTRVGLKFLESNLHRLSPSSRHLWEALSTDDFPRIS